MTVLDLEAEFKHLKSYDEGTKRSAQDRIRRAFVELQLLEPQLETYREIATRQARQIAELSTTIETLSQEPRPLSLSPESIEQIRAVHREFVDFGATTTLAPADKRSAEYGEIANLLAAWHIDADRIREDGWDAKGFWLRDSSGLGENRFVWPEGFPVDELHRLSQAAFTKRFKG